jgi:hypothetical protein
MQFNVTKALEIVGAPYAEPDGHVVVRSLFHSRSIWDVTAWDRADLSEPVLLATIGDTRLLVDGRHRARKAIAEGVSKLPCYILTEKETEQCFEGKAQKNRYLKLRNLLRGIEIKVDLYYSEPRSAAKRPLNGDHPPTVRRPR